MKQKAFDWIHSCWKLKHRKYWIMVHVLGFCLLACALISYVRTNKEIEQKLSYLVKEFVTVYNKHEEIYSSPLTQEERDKLAEYEKRLVKLNEALKSLDNDARQRLNENQKILKAKEKAENARSSYVNGVVERAEVLYKQQTEIYSNSPLSEVHTHLNEISKGAEMLDSEVSALPEKCRIEYDKNSRVIVAQQALEAARKKFVDNLNAALEGVYKAQCAVYENIKIGEPGDPPIIPSELLQHESQLLDVAGKLNKSESTYYNASRVQEAKEKVQESRANYVDMLAESATDLYMEYIKAYRGVPNFRAIEQRLGSLVGKHAHLCRLVNALDDTSKKRFYGNPVLQKKEEEYKEARDRYEFQISE